MSSSGFAARIDHTLLKPEASVADAHRLVDEAVEHRFASACVNGALLSPTRRRLDELGGVSAHGVRLCGVAAFPLGAATAMQRAVEATQVVKAGAEEVDIVAWLPQLIEKDRAGLRDDLLQTTRAVRAAGQNIIVKVILETAALRAAAKNEAAFEAMIAAGCEAVAEAGADFVKTSTGFHPAGGADEHAVTLLRKHAGPLGVKAAGGVRTYDDARRMLDAGADRIGSSSSVAIVEGASARSI